ncbi:MAG: tRNA lysidine(34) synthetase TilS [Bacteroidia bacterium]|nr:tRNA lysidine(34) synthetase TilS [Bacteroidia bacterium]MCX7651333.1 tRNA lysidine(34) synthetase TilS [Bacteroidia bacterium]
MSQRLEKYLTPPEKVLLAFSGGPDSVALALILRELGYAVHLAYVNHNLRGPASEAEEKWIRTWAQKQALPLSVLSIQPKTFQGGRGIQAEARKLRYAWMEEQLAAHGIFWGATAHTLDDQVETLIYRLLRSGLYPELRGIPYRRRRWLRPLLFTPRNEIIAYLRERKADYLLDTSNYTPKYLRNQLRWWILPPMYRINPAFKRTCIQRYEISQLQQKHLRRLYRHWESKSFLAKPYGEILVRNLPKDAFYYILKKRWGLDSHDLARLWLLWRAKHSGARYDREGFTYIRTPDGLARGSSTLWQPDWPALQLLPREMTFQWGYWHIKTGVTASPPSGALAWRVHQLRFPLTLRLWRLGDRLMPFGLQGRSKKVSDIWPEIGLYGFERQHAFVVEDAEGTLVGVVGYRVSQDTAWTAFSGESFYLRAQYGDPL